MRDRAIHNANSFKIVCVCSVFLAGVVCASMPKKLGRSRCCDFVNKLNVEIGDFRMFRVWLFVDIFFEFVLV